VINEPRFVPALGRFLTAAIFLNSGVDKIWAPAAVERYIASAGLPFPSLGLLIAITIELGGGLALLLGYRVRLVALGLAGFTIVTALIFHSNLADHNQFIHFMKNIAIAGGLLQVVAFGAGLLSIDAYRAGAPALRELRNSSYREPTNAAH
jgi:putative oxidoreductase